MAPAQRLRVGLYAAYPMWIEGFGALFARHPRLVFVPTGLTGLIHDLTLDLAVIGMHGAVSALSVVTAIRALRPTLRILLLGPAASDEQLLAAVTAGAKAYLEDTVSSEEVEHSIESVENGSIWIPRRVLSAFVEKANRREGRVGANPTEVQLTAREKQVLQELVAARTNPEIAERLAIEERTVKAHIAKLLRKFGVENRIALSIIAVSNGLVGTPGGQSG